MTYHRNQQNLVIANVSRRGLLKGAAGSGLFVLAAQFPAVRSAMAYATGAEKMPHGVVTNPHIFVSIDKDGTVNIVAARAEMGTGAARTTLPMIVADELDADWARVRVVQSPGDEETYGNQDTDGSRSVRHFIQPMRQVGAGARQMLETAAAKRWNVPVSEVKASLHEVVHTPSGKKLGYGELAADAAALPAPALDTLRLKEPSAFRYIGKGNVQIVDLFDITTGNTTYGQDVKLPGLKFAVVARSPVVGGKVASYDAAATMKVPGVVKVVAIDGTPAPAAFAPKAGVAVIANNTWAALKGRDALKIVWDDGPNGSFNSVAYKAMLEENVRKPGKVERNEGDVDAALGSAAKVISAEYYSPHLAHAPMEPPSATARMTDGKWDIWTSVQSPGGARDDVAKRLGVEPKNVTLHEMLLGGGFGRKSKWDFAIEAVLLSKAMEGAPVKVVWTREDDIQHGFYHTVTAERLEAGIDKDKKVVAWRHRSAAPSLFANFMPDPKYPQFIELGLGFVDTPFNVPNVRLESGEAQSHVRVGWFRSVNNVAHAWAIQSFVAEIAHELGRDPKDFLLELIGPARIVDAPLHATTTLVGLRRALRHLSGGYRTVAAGRRACGRKGRLGTAVAQGSRARHRGASQLRELRCHGGRGRRRRQRQLLGAAGRYCDRLRLRRQPRTHPLSDRGCGGDGTDAREIQRDHAQEGTRRAEQLQRLPGCPHRRIADLDEHAHRRERHRGPVERRRRAGRAAVCAGALQRDLCCDR